MTDEEFFNMLRGVLAKLGFLDRIVTNLEAWWSMEEENKAMIFMVGLSVVFFGLWLMVNGLPEDGE